MTYHIKKLFNGLWSSGTLLGDGGLQFVTMGLGSFTVTETLPHESVAPIFIGDCKQTGLAQIQQLVS